jgi:RNA polymerase sigma factor (sigma-70 family)
VMKTRYGDTLRHIRTLFNVGTLGGLTDGQLLERFTTCTGEAAELAFAALVERHGPMVLRVCQSVLRDPHDAQDAFQATFLILVRKAGSIRKRDSLASWLHGVAGRVAACSRAATARRHRHERRAAEWAVTSVDAEDRDDLASVLHSELDRLPEKYRAPIVLCYLENLTHEQAAQKLHWPVGTVRSRLARGREQLRGRLTRRGLALSVGLLHGALSAETATAAFPVVLASITAEAAVQYASNRFLTTGVASASVTLLLKGAMKAMFVNKLKLAVLAFGLITAGAVVVAQQAARTGAAEARPVKTGVTESTADDAIVARELRRLDIDLLAEEVDQLRDRVEVSLRAKLRAERRNFAVKVEGQGTEPKEVKEAQSAYESARNSYLARSRELRGEQRRLSGDRVGDKESGSSGSTLSAAAIGSIDMDAVFDRYEKARQANDELKAHMKSEQDRLAKLRYQIDELNLKKRKFSPESSDFALLESQIEALRKHAGSESEAVEREFDQRKASNMVALYGEIQQTTASLARAKGMIYVAKVESGLKPGMAPSQMMAVLNDSVVYSDPRNDLTEEVIRELNQRIKAAGDKTSS